MRLFLCLDSLGEAEGQACLPGVCTRSNTSQIGQTEIKVSTDLDRQTPDLMQDTSRYICIWHFSYVSEQPLSYQRECILLLRYIRIHSRYNVEYIVSRILSCIHVEYIWDTSGYTSRYVISSPTYSCCACRLERLGDSLGTF